MTCVAARAAVDLAIDDERPAFGVAERDAALDAIRFPAHTAALVVHPGAQRRGGGSGFSFDAPHADGAVAPHGGRTQRANHEPHAETACDDRNHAPLSLPGGEREKKRRRAEAEQNPHHRAPATGRGQHGDEPKTSRQGTDDGAKGIDGVSHADLTAHVLASTAEQRDEERKLDPCHDRGGKNDEHGHRRPTEQHSRKAEYAERSQEQRQHGHAIAERVRNREKHRFEKTRRRKRRQRGPPATTEGGIERAAETDAEQGHGEDEPEREHRPAQDGPEHAVPDELHEKKGEPREPGGSQRKPRGRPATGVRRAIGERIESALDLGTRRRVRRAFRSDPGCDEPHGKVDGACNPKRGPRSEYLQHIERRCRASDDSAQRVDAIEQARAAPAQIVVDFHAPSRGRQRASHEERWRRENQRRQREAKYRSSQEPELGRAAEGDVDPAGDAHQARRRGRERRDE